MKKLFFWLLCTFIGFVNARAQEIPENLNDSMFSTYYQQRVSHFRTLPIKEGQIIFLGNSITDGGEWSELFDNDPNILNRGISGDITAGVLNRLDEVIRRKPSKIFLLIGTNDLAHGITADSIERNIFLIAQIVHKNSPRTELYIQSVTPVNNYYKKFGDHTGNGPIIAQINDVLKSNSTKYQYTYIDIHSLFANAEDKFNIHLTNDGLHLKGDAYEMWKRKIYPYVYDLQVKPALLPFPQKVVWKDDFFPLYKCTSILIADDSLKSVAVDLQRIIAKNGYAVSIQKTKTNAPAIVIKMGKVSAGRLGREAYKLAVDNRQIILTANTLHGLFNGVQTLRQLMRDKSIVEGCAIRDWPSFAWRGYMVDVGRNYQSMDLLKQQIDVMASLKMNIFHFHLTEDVAWRLQVKGFPQLTEAKNMTRNQGMFYSEQQVKELIDYCKKRFITLIAEIDMPGHSAAFKRAMGFDMQSDSGLYVMKKIVRQICDTYNVPYLHIGADEVKISNKSFLPEIISLIESRGKKVVGWDPGGEFTPTVIRQRWQSVANKTVAKSPFLQIDSRNLYINHMDAEESVVSIFNHKICDTTVGDNNNLGGTVCLWNDRRLNTGMDNLLQNPVYPAMLAFAERTWRGGGYCSDNQVYLSDAASVEFKDFTAFENRLIDIKKEFFSTLSFPYVRQSNIHWQLIGPYDNRGDLSTSFVPEKKSFNFEDADNSVTVNGATIILRHFWNPAVKGILSHPKENTTYYAYAKYWSNVDTSAFMWIGFRDFSRSTATATPKENTWNGLQSEIWLNDKIVTPPHWQRAGQQGNSEIPYVDENYYFRKPTVVHLQKGWNKILLKMPIGKFESGIWYAPFKWMFTAVFVQPEQGSKNMQVSNMRIH
ncbi:family 20 glycosylhydrolase [Arachidicoccus sp.]|uniref:family 20 glycosylhydrolase n=1 Tax=Arachidicoccus sp. TaxID=1872624 RepID=UPI003D226F6C